MQFERGPPWNPIKQKPQWESPKPEIHQEIIDNRPKYVKYYEKPKEQRPKFVNKPRIDRPMEAHPVLKPKFVSHIIESKPQLRPNVRPKLVAAKLKVTTPAKTKVKVHPKVSPTEERDEKSTKNTETSKIYQGPPLDEGVADTAAPGGHYELSPLMSRMLETELQDIMIKVWQELPDNPTSEAEKLVVNKLRNKAGDDLRNVFGLNVSQRLLNVFNMFYIKMKFTSNPEGQNLTKFLIKNNITDFKWNNFKPLTYNAVVKNVKDFDRLCTTLFHTIGNVHVTITPLYQFTKCPLKLRTSYHISNTTSKNATKEEASDQSNSSTEVSKAKPEESPSKANETKSANINTADTQLEDTKAAKEKIVESPPPVVKETAKPEIISKEKPKEVAKQTTNDANKIVEKPSTKKFEKIPIEKKEVKKEPAKRPVDKKEVTKEPVKRPVDKKEVTKEPVKKPVDKKEVKKEPVKKPVDKKPKASCKNIILQAGNDYDELNDDEIMALVSQGIILDQCSGSDED